jgi:ankyrin repeat protein
LLIVNTQNGNTALMIAAAVKDQVDIVELLLAREDVEINIPNKATINLIQKYILFVDRVVMLHSLSLV